MSTAPRLFASMPAATASTPGTRRSDDALAAALTGQPVVAVIGSVVPTEVILAAGCFPVSVTARAEDWDVAADPMEPGHEIEVRSLFHQLVQGAYEFAELLVLPGSSDGYRYLYQYLREIQRQGRGDRIPTIVPYDILFGDSPPMRRHRLDVLGELVRRLEVLTGRDVGDTTLREAIELTNRTRSLARRLNDLRADRRVLGAPAHAALRVAGFRNPATYADELEEGLESCASMQLRPGRPRLLLVSSVPLYHERVHELLERVGGQVAAEDDEWGARRGCPDIDPTTPTLQAIADHYAKHAVSPRMLESDREAWLRAEFASGRYDGVVFYVPPDDQFFGWRYPALRSLAEQHALPSLLLRQEVLDPAAEARMASAARGFVEGLVPVLGGTDA